jgi:hypothetical protein
VLAVAAADLSQITLATMEGLAVAADTAQPAVQATLPPLALYKAIMVDLILLTLPLDSAVVAVVALVLLVQQRSMVAMAMVEQVLFLLLRGLL